MLNLKLEIGRLSGSKLGVTSRAKIPLGRVKSSERPVIGQFSDSPTQVTFSASPAANYDSAFVPHGTVPDGQENTFSALSLGRVIDKKFVLERYPQIK